MDILCTRCKKPIHGWFRRYRNEETDMTYVWHADPVNNCWELCRIEIMYAYLDCIRKAARREVK